MIAAENITRQMCRTRRSNNRSCSNTSSASGAVRSSENRS